MIQIVIMAPSSSMELAEKRRPLSRTILASQRSRMRHSQEYSTLHPTIDYRVLPNPSLRFHNKTTFYQATLLPQWHPSKTKNHYRIKENKKQKMLKKLNYPLMRRSSWKTKFWKYWSATKEARDSFKRLKEPRGNKNKRHFRKTSPQKRSHWKPLKKVSSKFIISNRNQDQG